MDDAWTVPADVVGNVTRRWPDRDRWTAHVEQGLRDLCTTYRARPRRVMPARYGFVVAAETPHERLVLRASPDPDAHLQAKVAERLGQLDVSPTVHEIITSVDNVWTVIDEVVPGTALPHVDPANVAVEALAEPLAAMVGQPAPVPGMPSITDWLRERLEDDELNDLAPGSTIAPPSERAAALRTLNDLARNATPGLCHADASTWNALSAGAGRWKLIDPRGMAGEAAYDIATLGLKIGFRTGTSRVVARLANAAHVDAERTQAWATIVDAARV